MKAILALVVVGLLLGGCKPALPAPKKNPDLGTQGGATQVDTDTH